MSFLTLAMLGIIAASAYQLWRERREQTAIRFAMLIIFIIGASLVMASETLRGRP
jgi:uncharacterized membrane protein